MPPVKEVAFLWQVDDRADFVPEDVTGLHDRVAFLSREGVRRRALMIAGVRRAAAARAPALAKAAADRALSAAGLILEAGGFPAGQPLPPPARDPLFVTWAGPA